jgi:4-amino-4-deoxy-L-arabinose transferase-like glycosyltransferase
MDFQAANAELFMNLPLVGALLVYVSARRQDRAVRYLWAGLLLACAALIKLQAGYVAAAVLIHAVATRGRRWPLLLGLVGLALPAVAVLLWYWRAGALDELLWAARYNSLYVGAQDLATHGRRALERGAIFLGLDLVLVVPAVAQLARRGAPGSASRDAWFLLTTWSLVSLLAVATGGRYFLHYFIQLVPPLAVAAAPRLLAWGEKRVARGVAMSLVLLAAATSVAAALLDRQLRPREAWHQDRYAAVGSYVREHSAPGERLFVWGDSPALYLQARRRPGTRYLWVNYQLGRIWGTPADEIDAPARPELSSPETWPRLLQDLERRRPALIVDAAAGGLDELDRHPLTRYASVARLVERDYRLEAHVLGVPIYRRKDR